MPTLTLRELDQFCTVMQWTAEIDGDSMLAVLFENITGLFMGVIPLC